MSHRPSKLPVPIAPRAARLPTCLVIACLACGGDPPAPGGGPALDLARERAEFAGWLQHAPASPYRALVQHPVGSGITLGPPEADVPLEGVGRYRVEERDGRLSLIVAEAPRPLWRDRLVSIGSYQLLAGGPPGRTLLTVFGDSARGVRPPAYYPESPAWRYEVTLEPSGGTGDQQVLLGADGTEVAATEAGQVTFPVDGTPVSLRVFRLPSAGGEESELEIYFQDRTNRSDTYPAGRFVNLIPSGGDRYWLDFNRARNPFCAYSAVYACPAPWRGNTVPAAVEAGERYPGGGLTPPPTG